MSKKSCNTLVNQLFLSNILISGLAWAVCLLVWRDLLSALVFGQMASTFLILAYISEK